jgi:hypothetical protein
MRVSKIPTKNGNEGGHFHKSWITTNEFIV